MPDPAKPRPVRPQQHLVAQRDALLRLARADRRYAGELEKWYAALLPIERQRVRAYDALLVEYIRQAPRPAESIPEVLH